MKLNKNLLAVTLVFIVAFSVAGLIERQLQAETILQDSTHHAVTQHPNDIQGIYAAMAYPLSHYDQVSLFNTGSQSAFFEKAPLPDNSTRNEIYRFISANPGVQFRAICGGLGLSIGVVQFHLAQLQRSGLITGIRKGRYKRFFVAGRYSLRQMEAIAAFRLRTVKSILLALLSGKQVSHNRLATHVSISSQGLTWQMARLKSTGLIVETRSGLKVTYSLRPSCIRVLSEAASIVD